ncbi:WAT1-related protein At2g39510-like isoform X2 [Amborella trichopoda]|uniref:WAT1-related protein At2g39510-like isoform X2 n=1 Tax=Amborella trichopoda TaxID=13333 RepID=UPI0009BD16D9|nr:WAT1-related protein At2g39510-like isoform X2 [Amborella trichopoda]|eukprot:XP_020524201.1 WAT1-related protein At2g39510-like isoform X2 [Amborella trichopoda]
MKDWCPYMMMMVLQLGLGTGDIVSKGALEGGMSYHVFVVYRHAVTTLILSPLAFFLERKTRPPLTRPIFFKLCLLALCGYTVAQNAYFAGLFYSSPTVTSAMNNLCPAITFILAIIFRMEKVNTKTHRGQAKVLGTLICLGGAMTFIFYKGYLFPPLKDSSIDIHGLNSHSGATHAKSDWVKGSSFVILAMLCWSVFLILLTSLCKDYPAPLSMNAWIFCFVVIQSAAVAVIFERTASPWALDWDLKLLAYVYNGVLVSAIGYSLQTWCISKKGPVFVALFFPLQLIIAAILSALILRERLHLGRARITKIKS